MWVICLTDDTQKQKEMIACLEAYLRETGDRGPFSDWYDARNGKMMNSRAHSVQGGCFILLLEDAIKK